MTKEEYIKKMQAHMMAIAEAVSLDDLLTQLAEECAECSKAALKLRRAVGMAKTNPTPVTGEEALENLEEEIADLMIVIGVLGHYDVGGREETALAKLERWAGRVSHDEAGTKAETP